MKLKTLKILNLAVIGLIISVSSCKHTALKDLKPYQMVFKQQPDGMFCIEKEYWSESKVCKTSAEIAADPVWADSGYLFHNQNLVEMFTKMLGIKKEETIKVDPEL